MRKGCLSYFSFLSLFLSLLLRHFSFSGTIQCNPKSVRIRISHYHHQGRGGKKTTYKVRRKKSRARTSRSNTNGNSILPTNQRTRRDRKFIRLSITPIRTTRHTTTIDSRRSSRDSATPAIDNHRRAARSKRKSSSNTKSRSSELTRSESERDSLRAIDALENCHGHVCERGAADGVRQRSP